MNGAEDKLPRLIADLVLATSPVPDAIRFLSDGAGRVRGFDGVLIGIDPVRWFSRTSRAIVSFSKAHSVDFARICVPLRPSCRGLPTTLCKPRFFQAFSDAYMTCNRNDSTGSAGEPVRWTP